MMKLKWNNRSLWTILFVAAMSIYASQMVTPSWTLKKTQLDVKKDEAGKFYFTFKGKPQYIEPISSIHSSLMNDDIENVRVTKDSEELIEYVFEEKFEDGNMITSYYRVEAQRHFRFWSLLPAFVAVLLCWILKEPITALLGGIVAGSLLLGKYNILEDVFMPEFMTKNAAGVLLLYLWLLGGLMGVWSRTGAAQAFAEYMTKNFVRGPRSAKLVAWFLGIIFFQGGTVSTVLVGTTVKPLADKEKISHEELSYIVDSTASPIASQLAFNAWPGYVQSFIYVSGVAWLATEQDRIVFFFKSVPFCFYAIFAVLGTFLLSIDRPLFLGKKMKKAIKRARSTGQLDKPGATPMSAKELQKSHTPKNYKPHIIDFFAPLVTLIVLAIGTFIAYGSPMVRVAFGVSLLVACLLAIARGMKLKDLIEGITDGMKGVVLGSVILIMAITIGSISKQSGGGVFLVELLGTNIPYFILPVLLQILTMIIAFSTGSSWGTYAVAFPLAMPLSYAVAMSNGLAHPEFFMTICFAAVMDGSVYGDQCSPISDTTVLSAMCTGCDLMDHVRTQIPQASMAAGLAAVCWTGVTFLCA